MAALTALKKKWRERGGEVIAIRKRRAERSKQNSSFENKTISKSGRELEKQKSTPKVTKYGEFLLHDKN